MKWINAKERLPEDDQHVLAFNIWDEMIIVSYDFQSSYVDAHWWTGEYWESDLRITHWMPLPDPPNLGTISGHNALEQTGTKH